MKPRHHRQMKDLLSKTLQPVQPSTIAKELNLKTASVAQVLAFLYRKGDLTRERARITPHKQVWLYSLKLKTRPHGVTAPVPLLEGGGSNRQPLTDEHTLLTGGLDGGQQISDSLMIWIQTHAD